MKTILKLEEVGLFIFGIFLFHQLYFQWWWFLILILAPDISMIGYIMGNRVGALSYNFFHHRGVAVLVYLLGVYFNNQIIQLVGVILFSHSTMDRIFGYGLKYESGFKFTHLGEIEK